MGTERAPEGTERLPAPFGKFSLRRRLARGGMADVFLASLRGAEGFEKELVVKLVRADLSADEAFVRRFVDEAKTCVRLSHPNIVTIFELGVEDGVLYMAMELVRGVTLADLLGGTGALSPDEGAYLTLELARALDHAHRRGVIHRDVTPGNVMVDEEGAVKLLDFGIAAPVHGGLAGEVFGTPGHMPPEQLEGRRLSPATDLFALGTVAIEAWTGRAPFRRADAQASRTAMLEGSPPAPSSERPELASLDDVVLAMVAPSAAERPQHAEDVARRLRAFLRERGRDLDEVARGLAGKVARAIEVREARVVGKAVAGPSITRSLRPTPLAEGTRTFATRNEGAPERDESAPERDESAPGTRKLDELGGTRKLAEPTETRRLDPPAGQVRVDAPGDRPAGRPRWALIALVGLFGVLGLVGMLRMFGARREVPRPPEPPMLAVSTPSGSAGPAPSASPAAPSAVTSSAVASAPAPSGFASSNAAPASSGRLIVSSSPPAQVELDGRSVGGTPYSAMVTAGDHRVTLKPRGLGERFERTVAIAPGSAAEVRGDFNDEPSITVRKLPSR